MTTQPATECEHPEGMRIRLSACCGRPSATQLVEVSSRTKGFCEGCREWVEFELTCTGCRPTPEATVEAACEHLVRRWLSECCGAGFLDGVGIDGDAVGLCVACRNWSDFELVCAECATTVEATGEAA